MALTNDVSMFSIAPAEWLRVTDQELLTEFLPQDGSAIRFIAGDDDTLAESSGQLKALVTEKRLHYVELDPSHPDDTGKKPDFHQLHNLFFQVSKSIDWIEAARAQTLRALRDVGISMPGDELTTDIDSVAAFNEKTKAELEQDYQRLVTQAWLKDRDMGLDMRIALAALGRAQLDQDRVSPTTEEVLLGWLRGKVPVGGAAALRRINIYGTINRQNAAVMLRSLSHWLPKTGMSGLCILFDFRPYERVKPTSSEITAQWRRALRAAAESGTGLPPDAVLDLVGLEPSPGEIFYTKQAYMQAIELLRHLIDEIESFASTLIVVMASREFFDERPGPERSVRRFSDYGALQTRIGLEVHDARKQNPSASLTFLGGQNR